MKKSNRCISFDSYIKPQPMVVRSMSFKVVYLLIPTSNHNSSQFFINVLYVVYLLIPTSNHNYIVVYSITRMLYIF